MLCYCVPSKNINIFLISYGFLIIHLSLCKDIRRNIFLSGDKKKRNNATIVIRAANKSRSLASGDDYTLETSVPFTFRTRQSMADLFIECVQSHQGV